MKSRTALAKNLRGALKPTPKVSVSRWADSYRMLPSDSPEPGRWKTSRVPYMNQVMDAFTDGRLTRVVVKSSAQISKTECLLNVVGRYCHLAPANIMIVQPTLDAAMDFSKSRLSKMIADCKVLTPLFYEKLKTRDANQTILSKFYKGGRIILVGANSPAGLASRPIKILLCDEIDRYPQSASGGEGDPIDLAEKRTSNFFDKKIGIFSTPTVKGQSRIDIEYELGTQEEWRHRCPNCGTFQLLDFRHMICDADVKNDSAGNKTVVVRSVKWRCPDCGFDFDEQTIRSAAQAYVVQNPSAIENGVRSFFINGFASPWLKWKDIMREWLEAQGNPMREAVVYNTRFGLSYEMPSEVDDKLLNDKLTDYGADLPDGVLLLTAGVDVQKDRLEYGVYGWNGGGGWGICYGVLRGVPTEPDVWLALDAVLDKIFTFKDGTQLKIARTFIDSGYATQHVYSYCRSRFTKNAFAIKGKSIFGAPFIHKTGFLKDAGIFLTILNVDEGKNEIYSLLNAGNLHFGRDRDNLSRNFDDNFFRQLTAEHRVRKNTGREVWQLVSTSRRNEALDITGYALAALKSCMGASEPKLFWQNQLENLSGDVKPKPAAKQKLQTKVLDVY